jgi:hypothetical protein
VTERDRTAELLRAARSDAFAHGFDDRVLRRWQLSQRAGDSATDDWDRMLQRQFVRMAPLAAAAVLVLTVINAGGRSQEQALLDAALDLPPVTLGSAYDDAFAGVPR